MREQTVVSNITSLVEEQAKLCLLTCCITKEVFPYYKFILLNSDLDYGGHLQKRVCCKLSVTQDQAGYWEMNREKVCTKLTRKRNNVTEAIHKKMTSMYIHTRDKNNNNNVANTAPSYQHYFEKNVKPKEEVKKL
jgi:hypothetical protein